MKIFITGATGYIGGSIAAHFMNKGHSIVGLVRTEEKAAQLAALGIEPLLGDINDAQTLRVAAAEADAVVNAASSDNQDAAEALLAGLEGTGKTFIHTSGSGKMTDNAGGEYLSDRIYDEDTPFTPLPARAPRHNLDLTVCRAASRNIRTVVFCPPLIYGAGLGLHQNSVQLPLLAKQGLESGTVRIVGPGKNAYATVHIEDLVQAYELALESAPAGSFYFLENGEASFSDMGKAIAQRFNLKGPESWSVEEASAVWGMHAALALGSNSRVRAKRIRHDLGWTPTHRSVISWIEQQMKLN